MNIPNLPIWFLGFGILLCFSYLDIKKREVENEPILVYFILGLCVCIFIEKSFLVGFFMALTAIIGYALWKTKSIGGADVKILPSMMPFMLIGSANYFWAYFNFLIVFLCVGTSYALIYKNFIGKRRKNIPFVPGIAITYLLFGLLYMV